MKMFIYQILLVVGAQSYGSELQLQPGSSITINNQTISCMGSPYNVCYCRPFNQGDSGQAFLRRQGQSFDELLGTFRSLVDCQTYLVNNPVCR